jgi:Mce-associated membrane protein
MRRRDSRTWTAALLLAVVLLAAGASWLFWNAGVHREAERGGANAAQAARDSIVAISSYQPATVGETLGAAARDRLTGKFFDDYTQLVKTVVAPESIAKKITAAATVPAVAVVSAEPRHVVVLAYVDQTRTAGSGAPEKATSTVRVTMDNVDGRWLISDFEPI